MNTGSPTAKALIALLERDPDAGLLPYIKLAARMGMAKRRIEYMIERLRNKRIISRDHQGRLVVGVAPEVEVSKAATKPRQVLVVGAKQDLKGGRQRRERKYPARTDGKVPQYNPSPPKMSSDQQRELQRRQYEERVQVDAEIKARVERLRLARASANQDKPTLIRKRICFDCGDLAHRRPQRGKCSCGERYEPELVQVVMLGQSPIASCGD